MKSVELRSKLRLRRKRRIRKKISGTAESPRMSVFRSARHVYVQVIDDVTGQTLVSASSFEKGKKQNANCDACKEIGLRVAQRCKEKKIAKVCFDKNGSRYHGRVKAIADGAREGGLTF